MRPISEMKALGHLRVIKLGFQEFVSENFETKAKSCGTCPTRGSCCTDAHFVNVEITKLEATAIRDALADLDENLQRRVFARAAEAIAKYDLDSSENSYQKTFSCPLFEKEMGCIVHLTAKPLPCIHHACYENESDLPPDSLLDEKQKLLETLNEKTYGQKMTWAPIPVWLARMNPFGR